MNRILQYDQIDLAPTKITQRDDPLFGSVTVFHDVPIARTIVQQYEDGLAYKPANELENAAWTARDRWIVIGHHPDTAIISNRDDIGGRTTNIRFTNSLINSKTKRPEDRGILADLEVFDDKVPPDVLTAMKSGTKRDVSIGFFFDQDATPGVIGDDYPQLKGTKYDYVQRNIMIDHTAAALETGSGRCAFPECGIGADQFKQLVTGDPFAGYPTFEACIKDIMKKNPEYTRKQAAGTCAVIEQRSKEKHKSDEGEDFKPTDDDNLSMQTTIEEAKVYLRDILSKLDSIEFAPDDLVEEESQGNAESITESKRAMLFFNIPLDEWDALSEAEKEDYIGRLPPKKTRAGGEELSDRDCVYPWEDVREKILELFGRTDSVDPEIISPILKEMTFDGESVTISEETKSKLSEYGVDLDPCDEDEAAEGDEVETDELVIWMDAWILENVGEDAVLSYAQKKALPDSAYAYVEAGCEKEDGKTQQSCRHMPIHDPAHVRAALAALKGARTGKVPSYASKAKSKVCGAAKKFKIESEVCGTKREDLPSTDEVLRNAEKVLKDLERIVG